MERALYQISIIIILLLLIFTFRILISVKFSGCILFFVVQELRKDNSAYLESKQKVEDQLMGVQKRTETIMDELVRCQLQVDQLTSVSTPYIVIWNFITCPPTMYQILT